MRMRHAVARTATSVSESAGPAVVADLDATPQLALAFTPAPPPGTAAASRTRPRLTLAWPERPPRARNADGSPASRRADLYEWIARRRRAAQIAARHALGA